MRLFWNLILGKKGITFRPAIRIGKRAGITINKRGIFPTWRIK